MQFNKETPTGSFIIQEHAFNIPKPFTEGHRCTASEAGVLNQTLAENVRNNLAKRVKESVDKGEFDHTAMQAEIDQYLEEYEFGQRRGRGPTDPVEREALNIAKELVKKALREQGTKLADVDTADINDLAAQTVEANPAITKEAESRVKKRNEIGNVSLPDLASIGQKDAEATE